MRFKSDTHEYFNDKDEKYLSVSGVAKLLEQKKDWKSIADKKAKKLTKAGIPTTGQQLLDLWAEQRIKGSEAGTIYHAYEEEKLLNQKDVIIKPCSFTENFKYSLPPKLENNTIYPEYIIYSHKWKIAGQADKVEVRNNTIFLSDFKTDKKIDRKAFSSEWTEPEKLLPPVSHLDLCEFNTYSIKMSMYMYLLWENNMNLKVGSLTLNWIQFERDEQGIPILIDGFPIIKHKEDIDIPYLRKEIKDILEWYKQGKLK